MTERAQSLPPREWRDVLRQWQAQAQASGELDATEAQWLLAQALGLSHAGLYARLREPIDATALDRAEALWRRRLAGEPFAYLTGEQEFYGRPFQVTPAVLIPRADTECLLEAALARWPPQREGCVVDAGTGSGALAISFALERPTAVVWAVDLSPAALAVAAANARRLGAPIGFWRGSWLTALDAAAVDLIVANPPYIASDDPHLPALDRGGEPTSALVSADDGFGDLQLLIDQARMVLRPGGWLLLEHGWTQAPAVRARLAAAGYQQIGSSTDLGGHERVSFGCVAAP